MRGAIVRQMRLPTDSKMLGLIALCAILGPLDTVRITLDFFFFAMSHFLKYINTPIRRDLTFITCINERSEILVVNFSQRDFLGLA